MNHYFAGNHHPPSPSWNLSKWQGTCPTCLRYVRNFSRLIDAQTSKLHMRSLFLFSQTGYNEKFILTSAIIHGNRTTSQIQSMTNESDMEWNGLAGFTRHICGTACRQAEVAELVFTDIMCNSNHTESSSSPF